MAGLGSAGRGVFCRIGPAQGMAGMEAALAPASAAPVWTLVAQLRDATRRYGPSRAGLRCPCQSHWRSVRRHFRCPFRWVRQGRRFPALAGRLRPGRCSRAHRDSKLELMGMRRIRYRASFSDDLAFKSPFSITDHLTTIQAYLLSLSGFPNVPNNTSMPMRARSIKINPASGNAGTHPSDVIC